MENSEEYLVLSEPENMFSVIRGRSLLLMLFLSMVVPYWVAMDVWPDLFGSEIIPLPDAIVWLVAYSLLAGSICIACLRAGVADQISFVNQHSTKQIWSFSLLGIPFVAIAIFCIYLLYLPLSYVSPELVVLLVLEEPPIIWWEPGIESFLASLINSIVLVIIAPILEEVFFRGFLLNRWCQKYGIVKSIIFSSTIFAILHVDIIGGFVFAAILSLISLKTNSLVGPIIIHISNNAIVLLSLLVEGAIYGEITNSTLDEFRAYWWLAPIGAMIGIPWLTLFCRKLFFQTSKSVT